MVIGNVYGFMPRPKSAKRNLKQRRGRSQHVKDIKPELMRLLRKSGRRAMDLKIVVRSTVRRPQALSRRHGANNNAYAFSTHACTKTAGRDVAAAIIHDRDELNNVSAELCVGDWIIFHGVDENGNEDPDQPLWLGRVMSNPDDGWDGRGVKQNTTNRAVKYPMGVEVKKNEVAIYVQWYEKMNLNSNEPKYHVSRTITKAQVQSNQLLLHIGFDMKQLIGDNNPVPKSRPASERRRRETSATASLGEYARPRQNNQRSRESWHDKEYGIVWEMTERDRDYALGQRAV